ncbi:MAG: roadblock/LC7 domain-containing protein [Deltaproteobacteria bacterium]|nr:roadblock/LC7 domain-containing protein [Deltaproteobacteria bacterium]
MGFKKILKDMVKGVAGGYAGTIMEMDGITVEDYVKEGSVCDIEALGVEYGNVLGEIRKASMVLNLGEVEEIVVLSGNSRVIMRLVSPDYFLAFVVSGDAVLGRARYLAGKAAKTVREELLR